MKKRILLFTMVAGIGYLVLSSHSAGPAGSASYDCSGADVNSSSGNPTGCSTGSGCHSTTATAGITLVLELDSAGVTSSTTASGTGHYKPGFTYTVKITGTNTTANSLPKFGFQVAATKGATAATVPVNAGTLQSTGLPTGVHYVAAPGTTATFFANVVEHDMANAATTGGGATGSTYVESFTWTAPAAGTGVVSLFAALNAVNGIHGADAGDLWNTAQLVLNELPASTSVASVATNISLKAFPNPVINNMSLQMDNTQPGTYSLLVFDMTGKTITTETIVVNGTSYVSNINTSNWLPGNYHVVVEKDGTRQVIPVVKF